LTKKQLPLANLFISDCFVSSINLKSRFTRRIKKRRDERGVFLCLKKKDELGKSLCGMKDATPPKEGNYSA
jgi:hypothetical protein